MLASVLATLFLFSAIALLFIVGREAVIQRLHPVWMKWPGIARTFLPRTPYGLRLWLQIVAFLVFILALDLFGRYSMFLD